MERGGRKSRLEENDVVKIEDEDEEDINEEDIDEEDEVDLDEYERKTKKKTEEIQVEFEARVIEEVDFKVIRNFIAHFCQKQTFNSIEMAELIISQPQVGSIIKDLDSSESFGIITIINLDQDKSSIKQIKKYILSSVSKDQLSSWEKIINGPRLGLIINERIRNVPHIIAPQLNESLFQEITNAVKGGESFLFDHFLYITTFGLCDKGEVIPETPILQKKSKPERVYYKVEDEIYQKYSSLSATGSLSPTEARLFLIIPSDHTTNILNDISQHVIDYFTW